MRGKESPIQRAAGMTMFCALIIAALAWTGVHGFAGDGGQNDNTKKKERIQDVTERRGDAIHPKAGYELFKEGNKIYARRHGENVKGNSAHGSISCTCDGNGACIPNISLKDGSGHCAKEANEPCPHCQISYQQ